MIGGHNSYYHEIYDEKQKRMKPVYKFEYRLKDRALIYRKKSNELIMFGGCKWNEDFKQNVRFRYIDTFLVCKNPNNLKNIKWQEKKEWKLPYAMIGFGYFLLNDSKLFTFGGRKAGGDHSDECWMFDLNSNLWSLSSIKIPKSGKFHAILFENENEKTVQLFEFGHPKDANQSHFKINLNVLMKSMKIVEKLPAKRIIYDEYDSQKRMYSMNKLKGGNKLSLNELANEVVNNKDLSKNMRKKMAKKLRKKQKKLHNFNKNKQSVYGKDNNNNNSFPTIELDKSGQQQEVDSNHNNSMLKVGVVGVIAAALIFYYRNQNKPT